MKTKKKKKKILKGDDMKIVYRDIIYSGIVDTLRDCSEVRELANVCPYPHTRTKQF